MNRQLSEAYMHGCTSRQQFVIQKLKHMRRRKTWGDGAPVFWNQSIGKIRQTS